MLTREEFAQQITNRRIFYFICDALNTSEPHYFVCIVVQPGQIINLSCCTSQFETVRRLIERRRYPPETLVYISKDDPDNPFHKDTYINCNEYFQYSIDEFWDLYFNNGLRIAGDLPLHSFDQILTGFKASEVIEQEFKDFLPSLDDVDP